MSEEFLVTKVDQVVMSSIDHLLSPNEVGKACKRLRKTKCYAVKQR